MSGKSLWTLSHEVKWRRLCCFWSRRWSGGARILFSDKGVSWLPTADSLSQLQSTFLSLPVPVPQTNVLRHLVIDIWSHLQSIYIIYVQSIIVSNHFKMYCTYHLLATETFLLLYVYIYIYTYYTSIPFSTIVKPPFSQQIEIPEPGRRSTAPVFFLWFLSQSKIRPESFRCHRTEAAWRRQRHQCRDFVQFKSFILWQPKTQKPVWKKVCVLRRLLSLLSVYFRWCSYLIAGWLLSTYAPALDCSGFPKPQMQIFEQKISC